ncbi:MAG TPA: sulfatase [Anseongella sp.]|nr:sulfatase [Anseongella sp.]
MKLLISLVLLLAFAASCGHQKQQPARPNVLFIAVDDLRTQLGCYGDPLAKTPNIDRLADMGLVFDRAYCQQAVCNPSRASVMTGRRPNTTRVWDLSTHFRENLPDVVTLPQYFRQQGYHTQALGKIYHDPAWAQDSLSWSAPEILAITGARGKYVLNSNLHRKGSRKAAAAESAAVEDDAYIDGKVADAAVKLLSEVKGKPFFLAVGFRRPHLPFSAPGSYWDLYNRDSLPLPRFAQAPEGAPELALHDSEELRGYTDIPDAGALREEKIRELIHGYYASTSYVDAQIGKLLRELERLGLRENTIIVLWSDHGYHLGEHGLWTKTTNFELDARVPLIISAPGREEGGHSEALVELVDLYPTLAELAGLPLPSGLEGSSMKPLLTDAGRPWKKAAFTQFPRPWRYKKEPKVMGYSMRTNQYRYTEWQDFRTGETISAELYDLREDSLEKKNLAGDAAFSEEVRELSSMLRKGWEEALPE